MKKLIQINTVFYASTGRIMADIQKYAETQGYDTISFVGRGPASKNIKGKIFGNPISFWSHVVITTLFDAQGYGSYFATKKLIRWLREEKPDIIHLHNLHGYYLHIPMLCRYLKEEYRGKVFWTFHDCWPMTGHCAHFVSVDCNRWKTECYRCPKKKEYPISFFVDGSKRNYKMKKQNFQNIPNLTIITPSKWIKSIVSESFLKDKRAEVVYNGIDLQTFKNIKDEELWNKYGIPKGKRIILGVSSVWNRNKGLYDFIEIANELPEDYHIVMVGLSKRQVWQLPGNITGIERTNNIDELVRMYSNADVFVNPSIEESFSLVTVEAMACGTPVIVLDTSAVKELVDEKSGLVLKQHQPKDYIRAIQLVMKKNLRSTDIRTRAENFDKDKQVERIIELYNTV